MKITHSTCLGMLCIIGTISFSSGRAQDSSVEPFGGAVAPYQIAERGQDYAVFQKITETRGTAGLSVFQTNQFTLLENCLHYREQAEWKPSDDIIVPFPGGAIAEHSPNKAIFSPDLNAEAVFDIQAADGRRIRGGLRAIHLTDLATGQSLVLGTVRDSAPGKLLPPNRILYPDAFTGKISADVVLFWKHNYFSQDVLLRSRPELPADWDPANVRLEVISEFLVDVEPELRSRTIPAQGTRPEQRDDGVIRFGALAVVMGKAFTASEDNTYTLGGIAREGVPLSKRWYRAEDGRHFLVESLTWTEAAPQLEKLPVRQPGSAATAPPNSDEILVARAWPKSPPRMAMSQAIQVASSNHELLGYLLDFTIIPDQGTPTTLLSGQTYYIRTSYYSGSAVTFQPGCILKYKNSAYMLLYGDVYCPPLGQLMPVFTSRNDDNFGERIEGVVGEDPSDGDPTKHRAYPAIWAYYPDVHIDVINARVRWAKIGVEYDRNEWQYTDHIVRDCLFENITGTGSYGITGDLTYVSFANLRKCNVTSPGAPMTDDCGPLYTLASFSGINQTANSFGVPDTMGAVGPRHFMSVLNGEVAVFDRYTGQRRSPPTTLPAFLTVTVTNGPYAGTYDAYADPRIVYDHVHQRWIACALDANGSHHVILGVSNGPDPVGNGGASWVSDNWRTYLVPLGPCAYTDYPTLGVDANGIYITVSGFRDGCVLGALKVAALPKGPLLTLNPPAPQVQDYLIYTDTTITGSPITQPAVNLESIAATDPAWLVTSTSASELKCRQILWVNGVPQFQAWQTLTITQTLADNMGTAPQLGSAYGVDLRMQGERLMMAVARKVNGIEYLWTCRHIWVNKAGNNDASGGPADRSAIEWFKIQTANLQMESGRILDGAVSNQKFYFMPSLAVNKNGDMVLGFSGSSATSYIGAYYWGKLANGTSSAAPTLYFAGKDYFATAANLQWGDYSYTTLDPDGLTIWTIQEYAETRFSPNLGNAWGTRIAAITPF